MEDLAIIFLLFKWAASWLLKKFVLDVFWGVGESEFNAVDESEE